uniref:Uncharacterized protein MANES_09G096800 n=1 Tax=Rhizophora mucronata TaxID=61149 RepID=A0A2P2LPC5_RHIMU
MDVQKHVWIPICDTDVNFYIRSLQPRGLAETLCGSPLYMAPEIMQFQKYDAKADLWSVGAILFQLVTGKTPFTGNNQIQLLQNIMKSTELQFPSDNKDLTAECKDLCRKLLRRNPVERLTFEEFFNHPFVSRSKTDESLRSRVSSRSVDGFPLFEDNATINTEDNSQEDFLPFILDDDCSGPERSPSFSKDNSFTKSTSKIPLGSRADGREATSNVLNNMDFTSRYGTVRYNLDNANFRPAINKSSNENLAVLPKSTAQCSVNPLSGAMDSLELIDQDYVMVSGPFPGLSTASASTLKPSNLPCKSDSSLQAFVYSNAIPSVPVPIIGASKSNVCHTSSSESLSSAPATSQGSMDMGYAAEQPSTDGMTRIKSLQQYASAIAELAHEKMEMAKQLEAFSIQLVILAIWKQALHICHAQAASAIEGSPSQESTTLNRRSNKKHGSPDTENCPNVTEPTDLSAQIEKEFIREVAHADELAKGIEPGSTIMPDAMETIYQSALDLGKHGGAKELLRNNDSAVQLYTRAVRLFSFLLVEAPSLVLNPHLSLTNLTRHRLRTYINEINSRRRYLWSQKIDHKCGDKQCPP